MDLLTLWIFIFNEWWMMLGLQSKSVVASFTNEIPCSNPLGLMSGVIRDWQMSSSSNTSPITDPDCQVKYGRLMEAAGKAWCAGRAVPYEWLQIDLGVAAKITGLMTQGRCDGHQWVTSYHVSYSMDAFHWKYCSDVYNKRKLFNGNNDSHSIKICYLDEAIIARFIRFHVMEWRVHPSMRVEIVGCQECNELISLPPRAKLSASSWRPWKKQNTCSAQDGSFYSHGAWCAKNTNANQWLQVDLGPPTLVTGLVTKGRGDGRHRHWVTSYTVTYSNDSLVWYYYRDGNQRELKEFGGNMDQNTDRRHYLNQPFVARYIRFQPIKWKKRVSMRIGVIGCPHTGECGPGFFRVAEEAQCDHTVSVAYVNDLESLVENLAFRKLTWANDRRQSWPGWKYGHSSLAADGDPDPLLQKCAIMDNYFVDFPLWMVDLDAKRRINDVVIVTWQGNGRDRAHVYQDYVYSLEELSVYVANTPQIEDLPPNIRCAAISRHGGALFRPLLHFECPDGLEGRYVYVKAEAVAQRWNRIYSAILCEVFVY